jgi:hypothetical protein
MPENVSNRKYKVSCEAAVTLIPEVLRSSVTFVDVCFERTSDTLDKALILRLVFLNGESVKESYVFRR